MRHTISTDPIKPAWVLHGKDRNWVRLRQDEEEQLHAAHKENEVVVPLEGGRAEAHLGEGVYAATVFQRYAEDKPLALARSRWAYKPINGMWTPFPPVDDAALEAKLKRVKSARVEDEPSEDGVDPYSVTTSDGAYRVQFMRESGNIVGGTGSAMSGSGFVAGKVTILADIKCEAIKGSGLLASDNARTFGVVTRGWVGEVQPQIPQEELKVINAPPAALVLVVHGVGETLLRKEGKVLRFKDLEENVGSMRKQAIKSLAPPPEPAGAKSNGSSTTADSESTPRTGFFGRLVKSEPAPPPPPLSRVEFLAVDWHSSLRAAGGTAAWMRRLNQATLPSVPAMREITNDVLSDALLYEQPQHKKVILERVVSRINDMVAAWRKHNPGFEESGGKIVLCGHSLGALISFDVLQQSTLDAEEPTSPQSAKHKFRSIDPPRGLGCNCTFSALVTLGSPLGCFLAVRAQRLGKTFELPQASSTIYNIFARNDPVAYRLEGMLLEGAAEEVADAAPWSPPDEDDDIEWKEAPPPPTRMLSIPMGFTKPKAGPIVLAPPVHVPFATLKASERRKKIVESTNIGDLANRTTTTLLQGVGGVAQGVGGVAKGSVQKVNGVAKISVEKVSGQVQGMGTALKGLLQIDPMKSKMSKSNSLSEEGSLNNALQRAPSSFHGEQRLFGSEPVSWLVNGGGRVDYELQETEGDALKQPYGLALKAHTGYFTNPDVAAFLVHEVVGGVHVIGGGVPAEEEEFV